MTTTKQVDADRTACRSGLERHYRLRGQCGPGRVSTSHPRRAAGLEGAAEIYDLANERELRATEAETLTVPEGAVVVPGARPAPGSWAHVRGLSISAAVIVKYRDGKTDARTALEGALHRTA